MRFRTLGKTNLLVSEIGLGAAQIGGRSVTESQAEAVLKTALDSDVSFIDTAAMYGQSEERIGRYISDRKNEFIVATKCGDYEIESAANRRVVKDYTRQGILDTIDRSRQKLKLDVIDIVQFHGVPRPEDDEKEAYEALLEAKDKGWCSFVGISQDGKAAADAAKKWPLDTHEFTYNLLFQEADDLIFPTTRSKEAGTIIKRPIANAVYDIESRPDGDFMGKPWDRAQTFPLEELAGGMPSVEFALRFVLSHADVGTAIIGTTNPDHLRANVAVSDGKGLPDDVVHAAKSTFQEHFATR